mmetsp:Transcript_4805/g.11406  ORF Transcript_4805/g.11406 Transcript_4805/m.11406 type:complete len:151 (-) Transcript_4805:178-630(-)
MLDDVENEEDMNCDDDNAEFRLPSLGASAIRVELTCFKLLIFAHLNDDLSQLEPYVHCLVDRCAIGNRYRFGGINTRSVEFRALQWLCYAGLDIPKILRKKPSWKYQPKKRGPPRASQQRKSQNPPTVTQTPEHYDGDTVVNRIQVPRKL